ncbi:MAG TPA: hypothetical protein PKE51_08435 [Gemmatimonadaceae bacterium]|nr:hypothetical protein [Gemmatimonadaceae bacterium]
MRLIPAEWHASPGLSMEELRGQDGDFHVAVFVARRPAGDWVAVDSIRWHKSWIME